MRILGLMSLCLLSRGADRVEVRAQGLSEIAHLDVPRSVAGCERRRLPADSGAHHGRIGGLDRQGLQAGDAGAAALPAGRPQRFHLLGAGRGAGVCRRPGGARPVSVRDSARARGGPAGQGSARLVLVLGVLASFTFQVVYNITMSAGLAPVKGLTLPLMSYGGSSMIATLAGFGLVLNVRMRRFTN